ncbi:methyl-accepting chemotaxis protein [Pyxidicoccus fallax]|uniref:Methyl-accepting chemotaxis protein n=1 Tax=Pyxidicoccus fallax TaxID=394095 RepID=A0A848LUY3_9BACT|nr:methyl-accepting chemotaxis protein [Pyxidicoccus fallax]NMO21805.1 methyl-accepting chemotaxis protein [Pyxidicoccus fallax]NPC84284.1 methyl-accepting chemotaxis protein [Pyxidicoccus fallax]
MSTTTLPSPGALMRRMFLLRSLITMVAFTPALYVDIQLLDLKTEHELKIFLGVITPLVMGWCATAQPIMVMVWLFRRALGSEGALRVERLIRIPFQLTFLESMFSWAMGGVLFNGGVVLLLDRPPSVILVGVAVAVSAGLFSTPLMYMAFEHLMMPTVMDAYRNAPGAKPAGDGFAPRQLWLLPATVVSALLVTVLTSIVTLNLRLERSLSTLATDIQNQGETGAAERVRATIQPLRRDLVLPLAMFGGYAAVGSIFIATLAARRLAKGARAVGSSLEALVEGRATPPQWVSTDELGDLAANTWQLYQRLQELPRSLRTSAGDLASAGHRLSQASSQQNQTLSRQAAALHQARATAQEIQQASHVAASRATSILQVAEKAASVGKLGEESLAGTEKGLASIREIAAGLHEQMLDLEQRAREVGRVSEVVKSLADQSHMLAINAAIEATRAGEHGKGFGVVARQMRDLADQSIQATNQVRGLLENMATATHHATSMSDQGVEGVETALAPLRTSGERLRELAALSQESAIAVRQITEAVSQQHHGVDQLFAAVRELDELTTDTLRHLDTTQQAATAVTQATGQVAQLAERYV